MNYDKIYNKNIDLIMKIVNKTCSKSDYNRFKHDIKQEAYFWVINAMKSYNPKKGKLENWLINYTKAGLRRFLAENKYDIKLTEHGYRQLLDYNRGKLNKKQSNKIEMLIPLLNQDSLEDQYNSEL